MCLAKEGDRHQGILEAKQLKGKKKRLSYYTQSTRILVLMTDYISLVGEEFPYIWTAADARRLHTYIYVVDTIDAIVYTTKYMRRPTRR
jgi:hypothetical protein